MFLRTLIVCTLPALLRAAKSAPTPAPTPEFLAGELGQLQGQSVAVAAPSLLPTLLSVTFSLAFVVLLVYVTYWVLLRWRDRQGQGGAPVEQAHLRILARRSLDHRHSVVIVDAAGMLLVLGVGEDIRLLARVEDAEQAEALRSAAEAKGSGSLFDEQLERVTARLRKEEWRTKQKDIFEQGDEIQRKTQRLADLKRKNKE